MSDKKTTHGITNSDPMKEVIGSGNGMGTTKVFIDNSRSKEIFKIKDDTITTNLNNMETKKVSLDNGTVLEVGKKYTNGKYPFGNFQTVVAIVEDKVWMIDEEGYHDIESVNHNWIPYPTPQKERKTFLLEVEHSKTGITYEVLIRCNSIEEALMIHKNAKGIKEVKINVEPVNSLS